MIKSMNTKILKIVGLVLFIVLAGLVVVRVVFDEELDNLSQYLELRSEFKGDKSKFDQNFQKYIDSREKYRGDKDEFDKNFNAMAEWIEDYKRENPDATDAEAASAFRRAVEYGEKLDQQKQD